VTGLFEQPDAAATPLTPEETHGLIPAHIAYRSELNAAEQENIARAQDWAVSRRRDLLTEKFVKDLHRRMLGDVWRWAGKFRTSERNIGIEYWQIPVALRQSLDDTKRGSNIGPIRPTKSRCASITGWCRSTRSRTAMAATRV
jgi:fido (protein-threonine AMPylation protein)